jgi:hypothetical protein
MSGGKRPETVQICRDGNCLTAWPTKLALVPQLVAELCQEIGVTVHGGQRAVHDGHDVEYRVPSTEDSVLSTWPRPTVASPPWETAARWLSDAAIANRASSASLPKAA